MLKEKVQTVLNEQITLEAQSSQIYLAMASWAEVQGFEGITQYMYRQSDEERMHMLKIVKFINERGGHAIVSALQQPKIQYDSFKEIFEEAYHHELLVSESINNLVDITLQEKDFATHNFLQWYVAEQIEEESQAKMILDKINLIGEDKGVLYLFDRDILLLNPNSSVDNNI